MNTQARPIGDKIFQDTPRRVAKFRLTVGWIKMPRSMEVGLVPGHIVLHGDPQKGGTAPNFCPMSVVAKRLDG